MSTKSTTNSENSKTNCTVPLKSPYISYSKNNLKLKDEHSSTTSTSSFKSKDNYISRIQPMSVSCSFTPLDSDATISAEENEEYSLKLKKELEVAVSKKNLDDDLATTAGENSEFVDIPLEDIPREVEELKHDEDSSRGFSICSLSKDMNVASRKILSGPRMVTSDSYISINRRFFHGPQCVHPTELDGSVWEKPGSSRKPMNLTNVASDQISNLTPVSLYENDKYKTFTDSNSHEDDIQDSNKPFNVRKKSTSGKVDFKKGVELKNSSLMSISSTVCRICHTNTVNERLLSPCYCKGSLAYVHLSCLERWLNQSSRSYCELCLYQYNAVETLRYGFFEGIRLWVRHPRNRNHVRSDCLIAFLLTLVTLGLVVICFIGMDYFMIEGIKLGMSKMWTKSFIVSFLSVIVMGYVVTIYLIVRDQFVPWYTWWRNTLNIRLLLSPTVMQTQRI